MSGHCLPIFRKNVEDRTINVARFFAPQPPSLRKGRMLKRKPPPEPEFADDGKKAREERRKKGTVFVRPNQDKRPTFQFVDTQNRKSFIGVPDQDKDGTSAYVLLEVLNDSKVMCSLVNPYRFTPERDVSGINDVPKKPNSDPKKAEKEVEIEDVELAERQHMKESKKMQKRLRQQNRRLFEHINRSDTDPKKITEPSSLEELQESSKDMPARTKTDPSGSKATKTKPALPTGEEPIDSGNGPDDDDVEAPFRKALSTEAESHLVDELMAGELAGKLEGQQEFTGEFDEVFDDDEDDGVNKADIGGHAFEGYDNDDDDDDEENPAFKSSRARESERRMRSLLSGKGTKRKTTGKSIASSKKDSDDETDNLLWVSDISDFEGDSDGELESKQRAALSVTSSSSSSSSSRKRKMNGHQRNSSASNSLKRLRLSGLSLRERQRCLSTEEYLCPILIRSPPWTTQELVERYGLDSAEDSVKDAFRKLLAKVCYLKPLGTKRRIFLKPEYQRKYKNRK